MTQEQQEQRALLEKVLNHYGVKVKTIDELHKMTVQELQAYNASIDQVMTKVNADSIRVTERLAQQENSLSQLKEQALNKYGVDTVEGIQAKIDTLFSDLSVLLGEAPTASSPPETNVWGSPAPQF